jgi:hypothetical protein
MILRKLTTIKKMPMVRQTGKVYSRSATRMRKNQNGFPKNDVKEFRY